MKFLQRMIRLGSCCLGALLMTAYSQIAVAQADVPAHINLRLIEIHAGMADDFEDLIKQRTEAEIEAGVRFRHVFERIRGDLNGYLIVSPSDNGEPPELDLPNNWGRNVAKTIKDHRLLTARVGPRTMPGASVAPSGEYLYVRVRTVAPGKIAAYQNWQANKLIPALREQQNALDVRSARVVLGGNPGTHVRFAFMDDWPGLGGGGLGALADIVALENTMLSTSQNILYRVRHDLSFSPDP